MMKRMLTVLALLALSGTGAMAQPTSSIGMFADANPPLLTCNAAVPLYASVSVYFYALLDPAELPLAGGAEFMVSNWPGAGGITTPTWNTELVIGNAADGIALAFTTPLQAPIGYLGQVAFFATIESWIGSDHLLEIMPSPGQPFVKLANPGGDEFEAAGGVFWFNYTGTGTGCDTATDEASWGAVKALY